MGKFLTTSSIKQQLPQKGLYKLLTNELYQDDDGSIYLAWRGFQTDDFSWLNAEDWDTRCAHGHDVGCKYHQVVRVKLSAAQLKTLGYLHTENGEVVCEDLPVELLKVKDVSGHWINNLFYRMLRDADCPKTPICTQWLYRAGVAFNLNWFKSGKKKIELDKLYNEDWNCG